MKMSTKRSIAFILAMVMILAMVPMNVLAIGAAVGDKETTDTKTPPAAVENAVWVLVNSEECKQVEHQHSDSCYYKSCDHKNGHVSTCYSESTSYTLCEHADASEHTGSVTLADVVTIDGTNVSWKTEHPAYDTVRAVYQKAYDETYASAKYFKEAAAKAAGVAALVGKTFCYTTSASATPDKCNHTCSEVAGSCYTKICILPEHKHTTDCYKYTWELKSDVNKNGIADDADTYYTVKYVNDGTTVYEESILINMPTPTIANPEKAADAQYTYQFVGWDSTIADTVTADAVYTAVYTNIVNKYTVNWVDEDGTVLETDENVEYGAMPTYDGEEPQKVGDNTVSYSFAGWTPSVDTVKGDVTYTATYTTKDVYAVNFTIGTDVKTEYVVEGEVVAEYKPIKEHYKLTAWKDANGNVYDFTTPVNESITLSAEWELVEAVVEIVAPNATHTLANTIIPVGENYEFTVTPNAGYVIEGVSLNDEAIMIEHVDGSVTIKGTVANNVEKLTFVVKTAQTALVIDSATMNVYGDLDSNAIFNAVYNAEKSNPSDLKPEDVKVEYLAYTITLLNKTYDWWVVPGTNVSLKSFLDQFGIGALADYIPAESLPHEFGAEDVEKVRVTYAGNEKYPELMAETTVALVDNRIATEVILKDGVVVTYGATEEEILGLVFEAVYAHGKALTKDVSKVSIQMSSLNAGTRKAVVSFKGDNTYAASVAEVDVVIKKAQSFVNVNSTVVKYGTTIDISNVIKSNANCIEILMGLKTGDNVTADAGAIAHVNLPALINTEDIQNETVKKIVDELMSAIEDKMSGTMTIEELNKALNSALPYIESIEGYGYDVNLTTDSIKALIAVLDQMEDIDGINKIEVRVTVGEDVVIKDAGVYILAGVVSDANYTTSHGINYAIVYPDGYKAELDWRIHDENGIITIDALKNGYDLSAYVSKVYEGTLEGATAHLKTLFIGVDKDGKFSITSNQNELTFGAYTEIAFLADLGNTTYYATPIARSLIVTSDIVNVKFIDENGNENNDRVFAYGEDATMYAKAFDRNTNEEVTDGSMSYFYSGMQTNGEIYNGTKAPTYPGVYSVVAVFVGTNGTDVGTAIGALVIEQKNSDFALYDNTVTYDGNEHFVDVKDSVGFKHIYVVVDDANNVNVILPKDWNVEKTDALKTVEDIVKFLNSVELPAELAPYYSDFVKELNSVINEIDKEIDVKSIMINNKMPIEVGEYDVYGIAFGKADYKIVVDSALLTIEAVEEDPTDPTDPPQDPTDPTDPTDPVDPPKDPEDDKDDNDSPQTGDNSHLGLWIGLASASLVSLVALVFLGRKRKSED